MSKLQKILLAILIPVMVALIVITWGSIFSIILAATMFLIPVIYLANRFINTDEGSDLPTTATDNKNQSVPNAVRSDLLWIFSWFN